MLVGLAAESDNLAPWAGKSDGRIYASVLSEQLSRCERMWREFTRGERLSGSQQLVSLRFRPAQDWPQRVQSAVAFATCNVRLRPNIFMWT